MSNRVLISTYALSSLILCFLGWSYLFTYFKDEIHSIPLINLITNYLTLSGSFLSYIILGSWFFEKTFNIKYLLIFILLSLAIPFLLIGFLGISEVIFGHLFTITYIFIVLGGIIYSMLKNPKQTKTN